MGKFYTAMLLSGWRVCKWANHTSAEGQIYQYRSGTALRHVRFNLIFLHTTSFPDLESILILCVSSRAGISTDFDWSIMLLHVLIKMSHLVTSSLQNSPSSLEYLYTGGGLPCVSRRWFALHFKLASGLSGTNMVTDCEWDYLLWVRKLKSVV